MAAPPTPSDATSRPGFLGRLRRRLNKGNAWWTYDLARLMPGERLDEDTLETLETQLLLADVGVATTTRILGDLERHFGREQPADADAVLLALRESMLAILEPCAAPLLIPAEPRPWMILVVGVNGAGKTTTIGKLAARLTADNHTVMLAAGDTFRAAAIEQLKVWGERARVPVIAQQTGSDSAAVVYDAMQAASARQIDVLIADTAGRLHTQTNLMAELDKVRRVVTRLDPGAPHEVLLVIDASQGQNALIQARRFNETLGVTGIAITKLDGTAKGGILLSIAGELALPIRFIGIGEQIDDMQPFDADQYLDALLTRPASV